MLFFLQNSWFLKIREDWKLQSLYTKDYRLGEEEKPPLTTASRFLTEQTEPPSPWRGGWTELSASSSAVQSRKREHWQVFDAIKEIVLTFLKCDHTVVMLKEKRCCSMSGEFQFCKMKVRGWRHKNVNVLNTAELTLHVKMVKMVSFMCILPQICFKKGEKIYMGINDMSGICFKIIQGGVRITDKTKLVEVICWSYMTGNVGLLH